MMLIKLTSKGQLVIPKAIRQALGIDSGDQLEVRLVDRQIILEPVEGRSVIDLLQGRFAGDDLLEDHEAEHRLELANE